jgi:prenyltransferase/squalene oxidase-like repeat protein
VRSSLPKAFVVASIFFSVCRPFAGELEAGCAEAQKKGIDFLAATQRLTGGFISYEWGTVHPDKKLATETPFTVSQVVYSLNFCGDNSTARVVRERAAGWLVRDREEPGVWRYHGKNDKLPPDADDTAMAWVALQREGYSVFPRALDAVRVSRNEASLFNTWMGDPSAHVDSRETDAVVNLNVLLLFSLVHENFEAVCAYLLKHVENDSFRGGSIYYPSQWAFTYAFSRAYADGGVGCLKAAVPKIRSLTLSLQQGDGGWGSEYETALALLTLLNLGEKGAAIEKAMKFLTERQMSDGGWVLEAAYTGADRSMSYGSRAVTTALCVEAFAKYLRR